MSHRYRLMPTPEQEAVLLEHCAHARFVWNLCVEQDSWWWPGRKSAPGYMEQSRQLTAARAEFGWLRSGSQHVQQQALRDFQRAMAAFFDKSNPAQRPGYRGAKRGRQGSVASVARVRRLSRKWGSVHVPKYGYVRFRWTRDLPGKLGTARFTRDSSGRWHVSFPGAQSAVVRQPTGVAVGIDRGVRTAMVTSSGQHYRVPRVSDRDAARYLALQQRLSRQQRGSRKREKTRLAMARMAARVTDRRKDWTEKVSTRLVVDYDMIAFEKLNVRNMSGRPTVKPDPEQAGAYLPNGARRKAGLNRGILASCWGRLALRSVQKAVASGTAVVFVNPRFSSQECRRCGHIARENRESQAVFRCVSCGHSDHADANAARNVLARGLLMGNPCASPGTRGVRPRKTASAAAGTAREADSSGRREASVRLIAADVNPVRGCAASCSLATLASTIPV